MAYTRWIAGIIALALKDHIGERLIAGAEERRACMPVGRNNRPIKCVRIDPATEFPFKAERLIFSCLLRSSSRMMRAS
jgi:hypothetical protein